MITDVLGRTVCCWFHRRTWYDHSRLCIGFLPDPRKVVGVAAVDWARGDAWHFVGMHDTARLGMPRCDVDRGRGWPGHDARR